MAHTGAAKWRARRYLIFLGSMWLVVGPLLTLLKLDFKFCMEKSARVVKGVRYLSNSILEPPCAEALELRGMLMGVLDWG